MTQNKRLDRNQIGVILVGMYITKIPNRGSRPTTLLRESYREGNKVKSRTLSNLTHLPPYIIKLIRSALKGNKFVSTGEAFEIVENGSRLHGHVDAVLTAMKRLGFPELIASRRSRERDRVMALVVARILQPKTSKLSTPLWWEDTTLTEMLGVTDADEDDLYDAMDWLLKRQDGIEKKLATRHLSTDGLVLFDLTSSYFEGLTCPIAVLGHNRDGKKGKLQVNFGVLTNQRGIPVSVSVFSGNTGDSKTLLPQVEKVRNQFGIEEFVMVGDRGMLTQVQIDVLRKIDGVDWIGALHPEAIKKLVNCDTFQMGLFDEQNLFEITHPDFPGERLVACRNHELAHRRAEKRDSLLKATAKELTKVRRMIERDRLQGMAKIGPRVRGILKGYKIGRRYKVEIRDDGFEYELDKESLFAEIINKSKGNPELAEKRLARCKRHIETIKKKLDKVRERVERGRLHGKDVIGVRVGKVVNKYKVGKHFKLDIKDDSFNFEVDEEKVAAEAALDGIYVIRTSLSRERMGADNTVRSYKQLSRIESAYRSFKTMDLMVRPIRHHLERRVKAHIFLCMLAYYVLWHMAEAWRPLLYSDEDQEGKMTRDPVAPARRSDKALLKTRKKKLADGSRVYDLHSLLRHLSAIVRNTCRCPVDGPDSPTFTVDTTPNPKQRKALDLLQLIKT